jgi:hypothetical protein
LTIFKQNFNLIESKTVLTQHPGLLHPASGISRNLGLEAFAVQFPEFRNPELIERRKRRNGP